MSRRKDVPLDDWALPTQQPVVLLVQPRMTYEMRGDKQIRPEPSDAYTAKLFATLTAAVEHGAHVTVFPEYSWPVALAPKLRAWLEKDLPEGSGCVLPFEHTLLSDLPDLLDAMGVDAPGKQEFIAEMTAARGAVLPDKGFCNFLLFAAKTPGKLHLVPQAKLYAAHFEEISAGAPRRFIAGQKVRVILGKNISIATAICFDFIARDETVDERPRDSLLEGKVPDLFLVPECNPAPFHPSYARGLVSLYVAPSWARQPPVVLFANVAEGSRLPGMDNKKPFGFSRVFGRLGTHGPQAHPFFRHFEGVVTSEARSLDELEGKHQGLPLPPLRLLAIRPQESAVLLKLPTLRSGPTKDPEAGRIDTVVTPLRYIAPEMRWQQIHHAARPTPVHGQQGIPTELLDEARAGVHAQAEGKFEPRLRRAKGPLWVQGPGGSGKTTLVAKVLHDTIVKPELARVVWLDLSRSGGRGDVDELQASLLLALGKPRALKRKPEEQWQVIEGELLRKPTVLVLDSFERWSGAELRLPDRLQQVAANWPGRLVLTVRGGTSEADEVIPIALLEPEQAHAFLNHEAGKTVDRQLSDAIHSARGGLPLALSWVGGMLRGGTPTEQIREALLTAENEEGLKRLFKRTTEQLTIAASSILGVLALLPAKVTKEDLSSILELPPGKLGDALGALTARNLILREHGEGNDEAIYGRHPFVSQFMRQDAIQNPELQQRITRWALALLEQYGGDRHWHGYPWLWRRWPNLRAALYLLANSQEPSDQLRFLQGWRKADYPLWSGALWRDRVALGRKVLEVAPKLGEQGREYEAHAAYDSVAETEWHLNHDKEAIWPFFERAEKLWEALGRPREIALVNYYRARVVRNPKQPEETRQLLSAAERTADELKDEHLRALVLNQRGKLANAEGKPEEARRHFAEARLRFSQKGNSALYDPEMVAVVDRNEGKVELDQGNYGKALDLLERSMRGFQDLQLQVEEAETANLHAQALAHLGEREEATLEYRWGRGIMEDLGAGVREDEFRETEQLLVPPKPPHD